MVISSNLIIGVRPDLQRYKKLVNLLSNSTKLRDEFMSDPAAFLRLKGLAAHSSAVTISKQNLLFFGLLTSKKFPKLLRKIRKRDKLREVDLQKDAQEVIGIIRADPSLWKMVEGEPGKTLAHAPPEAEPDVFALILAVVVALFVAVAVAAVGVGVAVKAVAAVNVEVKVSGICGATRLRLGTQIEDLSSLTYLVRLCDFLFAP